MPAAYEPKGKVADLLAAMRNSPLDVWDATMVGEAMCVPRNNVAAYTHAVTKNGLLHVKVENGRSQFSLKPFPAAGEPSAAPAKWSATAPMVVLPPPPQPRAKAPAPEPFTFRASARGGNTTAPAPAPAPLHVPRFIGSEGPTPHEVDEQEEGDEAEPFSCKLHGDGDLDLHGLLELEGGGWRVPAEHAVTIKRLLTGEVVR